MQRTPIADRLWDGLVVPSDSLWIKGAEVMSDAPLTPSALAPQQSVPPRVAELATNLHVQANAARGLAERERAAAYAGFVHNCTACHETLRVERK